MKCNRCRELLSPYLDGVLTKDECRELENHLCFCGPCQEELAALRQTVNLLNAWSEEELDLPDGFEERLRSHLQQSCQPWHRRLPKNWISLAAAAAIVMAVAITAYADYFNLGLPLSQPRAASSSKIQAPPPDRERTEIFSLEIKAMDAQKATPEMKVQQAAPPPEQPRKATVVQPQMPEPVPNGRERNVVSPGNNINNITSRGQNAGAVPGEDQQAAQGEELPGQAAAVQDISVAGKANGPGDTTAGAGRAGGGAGETGDPGNDTGPPGTDPSLTIPEAVYDEASASAVPESIYEPPCS